MKIISKELYSQAYITKKYNQGKPLPFGTFVLKRTFSHIHFTDKFKLLRIGPYKIFYRLSDVTNELLSQDGSTLHVQRNLLIPYYPKGPLLYPHLRISIRFSDSTNKTFQNQLNTQIVIPLLFLPMKPNLTTIHYKIILPHLHHLTTILIFPQNTIHSPK